MIETSLESLVDKKVPPLRCLLSRVFNALSHENIQYCLLRDIGTIEELNAADELDLLVDDGQFRQLCDVLSRLQFIHLPSWGHAPHSFFLCYDADTDRWLKLDVVTEITYCTHVHSLRTPLARNCLTRRRVWGITAIPSPEDELITLLLHCVLDKGHFSKNHVQRVKSLCNQIEDEQYLSHLVATYWSHFPNWPKLAEYVTAEKWCVLLESTNSTVRNLRSGHPLSIRLRLIRDRLLRKLNRWVAHRRGKGLTVALLGPDGAGKSTAADGIYNSFYFPVYTIYMGLYKKKLAWVSSFRLPGLGLLCRIGTLWLRYLTATYHVTQGHLVLFDRYTYDALIPSQRPLSCFQRWRRWLLANACPAPDLTLILDAPGNVLYARKSEHSPALLEQQRRSYQDMISRSRTMVVLNGLHDPETVRREATSVIWKYLADKSRGIRHVQNY